MVAAANAVLRGKHVWSVQQVYDDKLNATYCGRDLHGFCAVEGTKNGAANGT
jgi:hypothetical protein